MNDKDSEWFLDMHIQLMNTFVSWVPMYSVPKPGFFIYLWYPKQGWQEVEGSEDKLPFRDIKPNLLPLSKKDIILESQFQCFT
ncbi:hypothetical protein MKW98_027510 [Papaver atlanticum]|uniref:Uncharacterized protein n=1 Tax=Papaver atlanticum TaxID=357466 RepID=A0AAD4RWC5_9MAGN|nr:hypothetical protein MKW98_027510 [Papaver atlanticum]